MALVYVDVKGMNSRPWNQSGLTLTIFIRITGTRCSCIIRKYRASTRRQKWESGGLRGKKNKRKRMGEDEISSCHFFSFLEVSGWILSVDLDNLGGSDRCRSTGVALR